MKKKGSRVIIIAERQKKKRKRILSEAKPQIRAHDSFNKFEEDNNDEIEWKKAKRRRRRTRVKIIVVVRRSFLTGPSTYILAGSLIHGDVV